MKKAVINENKSWGWIFLVFLVLFGIPLVLLYFSNQDAFAGAVFLIIWIVIVLFVEAVRGSSF